MTRDDDALDVASHTAVLVIQGIDDEVVPAEQAEAIVAALRQRAVPVTEQAGHRKAS